MNTRQYDAHNYRGFDWYQKMEKEKIRLYNTFSFTFEIAVLVSRDLTFVRTMINENHTKIGVRIVISGRHPNNSNHPHLLSQLRIKTLYTFSWSMANGQ